MSTVESNRQIIPFEAITNNTKLDFLIFSLRTCEACGLLDIPAPHLNVLIYQEENKHLKIDLKEITNIQFVSELPRKKIVTLII